MSTVSQSARVLAVLKDGKPHSVPEIHQKAGTMRLNSRVADLRKKGHMIVCERVKGKRGAEAYVYTLVESALRTKSGKILTDADIQELADEAEKGYDVSSLTDRQMRLDTDTIAPRIEGERLRIFRVKDGGEPEIVATAKTMDDVVACLCRLHREGEFDGYWIGVQDALGRKEKGKWIGKWLVLPWDEKGAA